MKDTEKSVEEKIRTIARHYGFSQQSTMMIEECSELQKAICKWHREFDRDSPDYSKTLDIINELTDVIIMAKQISYLLSVEDDVSERIEFKLNRQLRRMEKENADSVTE